MPRLSELTDFAYNDPMGNAVSALPVEKPFSELKKVYVTGEEELPVKFSGEPTPPVESSPLSNNIDKILNSIFRDDEKRLQLWPEKLIRSGTTAAGNVMSGKIPQWAIDKITGEVHTSPQMIEAAQEMSALAGTGGLAGGTTEATLGATPFLRPALKHKDRLYKGKPGQEHQDIIPDSLYQDFQKKAMSGEDLAEYNFGFLNDKGHFLTREKALEYGIANGLIDPHAGKYGALTTTLLADSSKPGVAIEAMKTAQPFFSALEHNVSAIPQAKMTGDQWLGTLANKPGVKPEEMQWTGLGEFLQANKGKPVTKAQIEEYLTSNKVELKEVVKGGEAGTKDRAFELAKEHGWKSWDEIDPITQAKYMQRASREAGENPTKYHSYQLPGGENYREMLLTLPKAKTLDQIATEKGYGGWHSGLTKEQQAEIISAHEGQKIPSNYSSSHWDEPNILAHVRMNDRTIDGKKSLHLEEIQSDWHQQGRDRGYKGSAKEIPYVEPDDLKITEGQYDWSVTTPSGKVVKVGKGVEKEEAGARDYLVRHINKGIAEANSNMRIAEAEKLPDAPFKKSWHELSLKRMIREAAEKGYDRLSWTPGEAQVARYDLSKQIDHLSYNPETKSLLGHKGNNQLVNQKVEADKLSDFVGKEAAKKLLDTKLNKAGYHELENADLKIGGEGMKGFYDQIIPKALEKLGKEHGVKVKQERLNKPQFSVSGEKLPDGREIYDVKVDGKLYSSFHTKAEAEAVAAKAEKEKMGTPVYYIDIPQSLKDTATQKGFPLFSKGGYMFQPVDFNPFEGKTELKT